MEQITVTFQKYDGSFDRTENIILDERLGEYREVVLPLLGLSDKQTYRFILIVNGNPTKEFNDNQTFREAGIRQNDRLALFPLDIWQQKKSTISIVNPKPITVQYDTPSNPTKPEAIIPDPLPTPPSPDAKNWRNAVIIGSLIGVAIIIGFVSTTKSPNTGFSSGISTQEVPSLTQAQAVEVVKKWLQAKQELFAPPFNRKLGAELTTGKAYQDNIGAGSSLEWLEENGAYYRYGIQKIDSVDQFSVNGGNATVEVTITEKRTFYKKGGIIDPENTALDTRLVRYTLQAENGQWKIANYKTIKVIRKS